MKNESVFLNQKSIFLAGSGRRKRFALLDVATLEDQNLSWKAKGIWATLISRTDDWKTRVAWLASLGPDGTKAIRSGLHELESSGYLLCRQRVGADGKFLPYEYLVLAARADIILNDAFIEEWKSKPADDTTDESGIVRVDPALQRRFAQIDQEALVSSLSFRAKGIWAYLMSRPETWEVSLREIINASRDGRDSNAAGIRELCDREYIARKKLRDAEGKFLMTEYWFFERPYSDLANEHKEIQALFLVENAEEKTEKAIFESPLSQNPVVDISPLSQNPVVGKTLPLSQNPVVDKKNNQAIDFIKEEPQPGLRQTVKRHTENAPILSTKTTYYASNVSQSDRNGSIAKSLPQNLVSKDQPNQPNQNEYLSMDDFWDKAGALELSEFLCSMSTDLKIFWAKYQRDILEELFLPLDSRRHRVWMLEKVFRLRSRKYSALGIFDMIHHDILTGNHPPIHQAPLTIVSTSAPKETTDWVSQVDSARVAELTSYGIEESLAKQIALSEKQFPVERISELQAHGYSFVDAYEAAEKELEDLKALNITKYSKGIDIKRSDSVSV